MPILFILFVVIPLAELMLLLKVGGIIGGFNTFSLVVITAFLGSYLLKREGSAALQRFNQRVNRGELPAAEIATGFALAAGGALLLTPGFITDVVGFVLVLPVSRVFFGRWLMTKLAGKVQVAGFGGHRGGFTQQSGGFHSHQQPDQANVFEGEVVQEDVIDAQIIDKQKKN